MKQMYKLLSVLTFLFWGVYALAQGSETFDNFPETGSSYNDGSFTGNDGSTWTYLQCRGDQTITGTSPMLGRNRTPDAEVTSGIISGGIGTLNFDYKQAFSTNASLEVYVNDILITTVTSSGEQGATKNSGDISVNVGGDVVISFKNPSGGQVNLDNVVWTAFADETAPTFSSTPTSGNITGNGAEFSFQLDEEGTLYYVVLADGTAAPTSAEVKAGEGGVASRTDGDPALFAGSVLVTDTEQSYSVTLDGLDGSTTYDVYAVAEDGAGNLQGAPAYLEIVTAVADAAAPVFQNTTPSSANITDTSFDLTVQLDEIGTVYYVVLADGTAAPSPEEVKDGQDGELPSRTDGNPALQSGSIDVTTGSQDFTITISGLVATTPYDIYVVAEDDETTPNLGSTSLLEISTVADNVAPTVESAATSATGVSYDITLTMSEAVTATDASGFTVSIDGEAATISDFGTSANEIGILLNEPIYAGAVVTVDYDDTQGDVADLATNALVSFADQAVTNNASIYLVADIATLRAGATDGTLYQLDGSAIVHSRQDFRNQKWVQDATAAILINDNPNGNFGAGYITTDYQIGDEIPAGLTGSLNLSNGQLTFEPADGYDPGTALSSGNEVAPQVLDLATFNANFQDYESELVTIEAVTFSDAGTGFSNGSNYDIVDGEETGAFRTEVFAFSGNDIPYGRVDITSPGGLFNTTPQLLGQSTGDIVDNYEPLFTVAPSIGNETIEGGDITFQSDEPGILYYLVLADEATEPSVAEVLAGTASAYMNVGTDNTVTLSGLTDNTAYDVYVLLSDNTNDGDTPVKLDLTTLEIVFDANTDITALSSPISQASLSSVNDTDVEAMDVFGFTISDEGTDGQSTLIETVAISAGANNTADWTTSLAGAVLTDGSVDIPLTIGEGTLTADLSAEAYELTNSSSQEFTVSVWFTDMVSDGEVLEFEIPTGHGFTAAATGSVFLTDLSSAITSAQHTIDVVATEFTVDYPVGVASGSTFEISASATDENGNVDTAARTVSLSGSGTGNLTGTGLTGQAMTDGLYTWSGLGFDANGDYTITVDDDGSALTFISGNISVFDQIGDLFISEYIEGGSNNKAVEIYNNFGGIVDLSDYTVGLYSNGSSTIGNNIVLSEIQPTLEQGEVLVIANSGSVQTILDAADITSSITFFNGDDALALLKNDVIIDAFGDIGTDPGSSWDVAGVSGATANKTLVRKGSVSQGNPTNLASFGTNETDSEWIVYNQDDFGYIGYHLLDGESIPLITLDQSGFDGNFSIVAFGNSSAPSMYSVTGADLTADMTITPPVGFELSATMAFDGDIYTNASPWVISPTDGDLSQDIYVRFTPVAADGASYSADINHTSTGAEAKTVSVLGVEGVFDTAPNLSGVVINEVLADPNGSAGYNYDTDGNGTADTADEFVEIHNNSESPVDISGWQLFEEDGAFMTFPAETVLGAGNYAAVIAAVQTDGTLPTPSDGNYAFESDALSISNGGENIALFNPVSGEYIQMKFGSGQADFDFSSATSGSLVSIIEDWGVDTDGSSLVREQPGSLTIVVHGEIQGADAASFAEPTIDPNAPAIELVADAFDPAFGNIPVLTESVVRTYTVSGSNLEADISISAPAGFVISSNATDYSSSLTLTQSAGTVSETTISVKFAPTEFGSSDGTIEHTSTNASQLDIDVSGAGIDENTIYFNGFGSCDNLSGFTAQSVSGDNTWDCTTNGETGDGLAMSGFSFQSFSGVVNEDWVVSPAINLSAVDGADLSFDTDVAFDGTGTLTVHVSADYTNDVTTATWTELTADIDLYAVETENDGVFVNSGDVALPVGGTVYVAFKYVSIDEPEGAVEYRIDNFLVTETQPFLEVDTDGFTGDFGLINVNETSIPGSFVVDAFGLSTDVTVTPPSQFEVSTTSDFSASVGTNSSPLTLTATDGAVDAVTVYARFAPTAVGAASGDITVSSTGFTDVTIAVSGSGNQVVLGLDNLEISVYPNPASSSFEVINKSNRALNVKLFGLDGAVMEMTRVGNTYDISHLSSGLYILKLTDDSGEEITRRIIKE